MSKIGEPQRIIEVEPLQEPQIEPVPVPEKERELEPV
jgi:hypothetical protein